jgi:hypothetical protein
MKKILLLLFIPIVAIKNVNAQKTHEDSIEVINAAHRYALRFKLSNSDLKKFKKEHFPGTSDYFKPDAKHTPTVLLNDSLFVKMYKLLAFNNVLDQQDIPSFPSLNPPHPMHNIATSIYTDDVQQTAQKDAEQFALSKALLIRFKEEHFATTSDYFKPVASNASNPALLNDSSYVQTFRFEAYVKSYHERAHPVGHGLLIAGIAATGTALIIAFLVGISRAFH